MIGSLRKRVSKAQVLERSIMICSREAASSRWNDLVTMSGGSNAGKAKRDESMIVRLRDDQIAPAPLVSLLARLG
jgi:hypothetical protein